MKRIIFITILAVILAAFISLVISTLITRRDAGAAEAPEGAIIWVDTCQGGTWVVIEDEDYDLWAVWCARFNWDTRALRWIRGRECIPHYSTKVTVLENILGTPKAICRYKYLMFGIWPRFGGS